jgi:photosystem II stability/assembly factor-like uncharacterized protein
VKINKAGLIFLVVFLILAIPVNALAGVNIWSTIGPLGSDGTSILALVIDPKAPSTLYAGVGNGVYKSGDGGMSWHAANNGLPSLVEVFSLGIDPQTTKTIYLGTNQIYKSTDGGRSWVESSNGLIGSDVLSIAVNPANSSIVYAGTSNGLYRSSNAGDSWEAINLGLPAGRINAITIDPSSPGTIYAGTETGGVY